MSVLSNEQKQPGVLVLLQGHCLSTCEACRFCIEFGISNVGTICMGPTRTWGDKR